jgi:hypothetical protein
MVGSCLRLVLAVLALLLEAGEIPLHEQINVAGTVFVYHKRFAVDVAVSERSCSFPL